MCVCVFVCCPVDCPLIVGAVCGCEQAVRCHLPHIFHVQGWWQQVIIGWGAQANG